MKPEEGERPHPRRTAKTSLSSDGLGPDLFCLRKSGEEMATYPTLHDEMPRGRTVLAIVDRRAGSAFNKKDGGDLGA